MKDVVPADSKYVPLTQQKWLCVPTCIQIVMLRHNIPLIPAEVIGYNMNLLVPKRDAALFWKPRTGKKPKAGWGTQLKEKLSANKLFKKMGIPLKLDWILIDEFKDFDQFKKYLGRITNSDKDFFVCFDWGNMFGTSYVGGHVCVLDKVYVDKGEIRMIDPEYRAPKWRVVKTKKLYQAMKFHGKKNSAGFWNLSLIK